MLEIGLRYHSPAAPIAAPLGTPDECPRVTLMVLESQPIVAFSYGNSIFHYATNLP